MSKVKKMIDTDFEQEMIWIEEILTEASSYGLRWEVEHTAGKYMEENPNLTRIEAFEHAFNDWIK